MTSRPGHPIAPKSGIVALCRVVLYDKIGPGSHPCHWCKKPVTWMPGKGLAPGALMADHLDWDNQNDSPENLVPSCNSCNSHRTRLGGRALIGEHEPTKRVGFGVTRAVKRYCNFCGKEFLAIPAEVRAGKGRYCSRSCARRGPGKH